MNRSMQAIEIVQPGGPEVLRLRRCAIPSPSSGEVLIRVMAAGVNRPDVMQRQGLYPPPPGASEIPGLEIAGEIVAVGEGVSESRIGEQVCALVTGGGYAQYCTASADLCLPFPRGLDAVRSAALPETFFTVWANLFQQAGIRSGDALLVHGGSSGIGTTAIQLARAFGAKVWVTAGSEEKCSACEQLGAVAINYRERDFVEAVRSATNGHGVDVILDMVGGDYLPRNLSCLATGGRLLQIAVQGGAKAEINLLTLILKRLTVSGSTLRPLSVVEKSRIAHALKEHVWALLEAGSVKPIVHAVFPLEQAAEAHRLMESSLHIGKIMLSVN